MWISQKYYSYVCTYVYAYYKTNVTIPVCTVVCQSKVLLYCKNYIKFCAHDIFKYVQIKMSIYAV